MTANHQSLANASGLLISGGIRLALLSFFAGLHLYSALNRSVNWDEFYFLSQIYEGERGTLALALQTSHIHLFGWLTKLPFDEIGQILTARLVMWAAHLATLYFIYRVTETLTSEQPAFFAIICYSGLHFVLQNATSFRTDPIITLLLMSVAYVLTRLRPGFFALVGAGIATAFAGLISIKSVFFIPTFAILAFIALVRSGFDRRLIKHFAIAGAISTVFFAGWLLWHSSTVSAAAADSGGVLAGVISKTLVETELLQRKFYLLVSLFTGSVQWTLLVCGLAIAVAAVFGRKRQDCLKETAVLALALPLLSLIFYRNAFAYYYVVVIAPASAAIGLGSQWFAKRFGFTLAIPVIIAVLTVTLAARDADEGHASQRSVVAAAHMMFPDVVPYLDRCSMVSSHIQTGFFMSTWGVENYRHSEFAELSDRIRRLQPVYVIANHAALRFAVDSRAEPPLPGYELIPADAQALRDNYVPHWGPILVAGKVLNPSFSRPLNFQINIAGEYTVEADAPVVLDGREVMPGGIVNLPVGTHTHLGASAVLRFGRHLPRPSWSPPESVFGVVSSGISRLPN